MPKAFVSKLGEGVIWWLQMESQSTQLQSKYSLMLITWRVFFFVPAGGHPGVGKTIMRFLGLDLGPARSPNAQLSQSQETELREELDKIGFFTWR